MPRTTSYHYDDYNTQMLNLITNTKITHTLCLSTTGHLLVNPTSLSTLFGARHC